MWRQYTYTILCSLCLLLVGCDYIPEDERLIYDPVILSEPNPNDNSEGEKPEQTKHIVLLEDFTGQRCLNCPTATEIIKQLQQACGDAFVSVAIHGGEQAIFSTAKVTGLRTEMGDEYFNFWNLKYKPVGLINRHGAVDCDKWATVVKEELSKPAPLRLDGFAVLTDNIITIQINAEGIDGSVTGKLQVWLLEDGIKALQLMPDGTANQEYIHNHVFRTAVNGTWGEDISVKEGEIVERIMKQTLEPNWNPEQLSIVAFVYNDDGVQQAVKFRVKTP